MSRYRMIEFVELDSTNRYACNNLRDLQDGDVIQALKQTAGHGRLKRRWISEGAGDLCMSLVLKSFQKKPSHLPLANLSQLLALGVCRVLDTHGIAANLKWPNDVLVNGQKIAGLLAETVVQGAGDFVGLVLGLGVNLNLGADAIKTIDQPATSLAGCSGKVVDVTAFRDAVLEDFFAHYEAFLAQGFQMIRVEYLMRCSFIGSQVRIRRGDEVIHGTACDLDANGALELSMADGMLRTVDLGEMF